jgi:DNA-binding XRE family transcriptional regulator
VAPGSISINAGKLLQNRLREERRGRGLTQKQLAGRVGVSRQSIIAIERGSRAPSVALALALARQLSTPVEALFWLDKGEGSE